MQSLKEGPTVTTASLEAVAGNGVRSRQRSNRVGVEDGSRR